MSVRSKFPDWRGMETFDGHPCLEAGDAVVICERDYGDHVIERHRKARVKYRSWEPPVLMVYPDRPEVDATLNARERAELTRLRSVLAAITEACAAADHAAGTSGAGRVGTARLRALIGSGDDDETGEGR